MMKKILRDNISVLENVNSWEESIVESSKKLLEKNYISKNYVEAMIENIKKLGPYVIISEHVAMPHARPSDGVHKTSLGLLKLNTPVMFGEGGELVKIIITLAAEDSNSHVDIISELVDFLQDDVKFSKLLAAKTIEEIINIL